MRTSVRVLKALVLMQASHRSRGDAMPNIYQAEVQQKHSNRGVNALTGRMP